MGRGNGRGLKWGGDWWLQTSGHEQESRGNGETSKSSCDVPSHGIPVNLLINNHYFYTYLPYLLGEVLVSREVVSIIPRLQVRFLQWLAYLCAQLGMLQELGRLEQDQLERLIILFYYTLIPTGFLALYIVAFPCILSWTQPLSPTAKPHCSGPYISHISPE